MKPSLFIFSGVMIILAAIVQIQPVNAGECPPNSAPVSEKDNVVHCRCIAGFENKGGVCVPMLKPESDKEKQQKAWKKALNCEMEDISSHIESFGPEGVTFAEELRNEIKNALGDAGKPVKDGKDVNDVNIVNISMDRTGKLNPGYDEGQYVVSIGVYTHGDGDIQVDIQGAFSRSMDKKDKHYEIDNYLRFDKSGNVKGKKTSGAVDACLAK